MASLFTKNGYPVGFDRIAPFAGAIPNADEVGQRVRREFCACNTSQTGVGKSTTKIFGIGAIGQFYGNLSLNAIARTQLWYRIHFKRVLKLVTAVNQGNVGAVFAAQISVAIRERKTHFNRIQFDATASALVNCGMTDADELDYRLSREFWWFGASSYQQQDQQRAKEIFKRFHHNC